MKNSLSTAASSLTFSGAPSACPAGEENLAIVERYYDLCHKWYKWFYSDRESLGVHYGWWDERTRSRKHSLLNHYQYLADTLRFQDGDLVLDAGCGVGGASLWLARHTAATFVGVTISTVQAKEAERNIRKRRLSDRVRVCKMNYFDLDFPDGTFDKIFGLESLCYSYPNPGLLFREFYRVLKRNGKFLMLDGILLRRPADARERALVDDFCHGFKMTGWSTGEEILEALKESGFQNVWFADKSPAMGKSVADIWMRTKIMSPIFGCLRALRLISQLEVENLLATTAQKRMYDAGLFGYGVFYGEK